MIRAEKTTTGNQDLPGESDTFPSEHVGFMVNPAHYGTGMRLWKYHRKCRRKENM